MVRASSLFEASACGMDYLIIHVAQLMALKSYEVVNIANEFRFARSNRSSCADMTAGMMLKMHTEEIGCEAMDVCEASSGLWFCDANVLCTGYHGFQVMRIWTWNTSYVQPARKLLEKRQLGVIVSV